MIPNVGGYDRLARLVVGPLLLAGVILAVLDNWSLGLGDTLDPVVLVLAAVVGAVLLITGLVRRCPLNSLLGIDTTP